MMSAWRALRLPWEAGILGALCGLRQAATIRVKGLGLWVQGSRLKV